MTRTQGKSGRTVNIQDQLLYQARRDRCQVNVYLINSLKLVGTISAYDTYSLLLESRGRTQLIFKHAISTIDFPDTISTTAPNQKTKKPPSRGENPEKPGSPSSEEGI